MNNNRRKKTYERSDRQIDGQAGREKEKPKNKKKKKMETEEKGEQCALQRLLITIIKSLHI